MPLTVAFANVYSFVLSVTSSVYCIFSCAVFSFFSSDTTSLSVASAFSADAETLEAADNPLMSLPDLLLPTLLAPMPAASFALEVLTSSHTVGI